ncbi:family 43 glycosylhydrolase [Saccharomonospora piscinae]|uniref:family 43 glycosylhydrolase n=1 Tax=Saccharomonospora piscinae TaxID=687388 RepID=UPI000466461C|nr:family 43 glycosylhydrolase [Saccharomonospora piscinae]
MGRRRRSSARSACALGVVAALVAACTAGEAAPRTGDAAGGGDLGGQSRAADPPPQPPAALAVDDPRGGERVVARGGADAPYNYGPTLLVEDGTVRMWWCSQYGSAAPAGDDILYAEARSVSGPFTGPGGGIPRAVLSGDPGGFDAVHTCDPSVIRVDGTYYLYYTGAAGDHAHGNAIGVATSTDGVNWTRAAEGPVVTAAHDDHRDNTYGTGQPAAVHLDGWFYLMFTDTTGGAAGWNGAGQFLLRSTDPTFARDVEALGEGGFEAVAGTAAPRTRSLVDAFSADLMWVDAMDAFAIAHQTAEGTGLTFWNRTFTASPYRPVTIPSEWEEGPGLVRQPDGHAPTSPRDVCGRVPFDVVQATVIGAANAPTGLRHYGLDAHGVAGCDDPGRALAVLDGIAVPSPLRTMDLVVDGRLLRVERRSVATELARRVLDERPPVLDDVPVAGHLRPGARAVRSEGHGLGLVLDGTLWPLRSPAALAPNDSPVSPVSDERWRQYPGGPALGYRAGSAS